MIVFVGSLRHFFSTRLRSECSYAPSLQAPADESYPQPRSVTWSSSSGRSTKTTGAGCRPESRSCRSIAILLCTRRHRSHSRRGASPARALAPRTRRVAARCFGLLLLRTSWAPLVASRDIPLRFPLKSRRLSPQKDIRRLSPRAAWRPKAPALRLERDVAHAPPRTKVPARPRLERRGGSTPPSCISFRIEQTEGSARHGCARRSHERHESTATGRPDAHFQRTLPPRLRFVSLLSLALASAEF